MNNNVYLCSVDDGSNIDLVIVFAEIEPQAIEIARNAALKKYNEEDIELEIGCTKLNPDEPYFWIP